MEGETDLATTNPSLASEWDYEKNAKLTPQMVTKGSHKKVWWKCPVGHSWPATIASRNAGKGCSKCHDFGTSFPEQAIIFYLKKHFSNVVGRDRSLGMELDILIPDLSIGVEYDGVVYHKSEGQVKRDNKKDRICKEHGIRLIRIRENGLSKTESAECVFRHSDTDIDLEQAISELLKLVEVEESVDINKDRIEILNQYYTYIKTSNLETKYPDMAKEWHPTKNGKLLPSMITPGYSKKVWWQCPNGHTYDASPAKRCLAGHGCRYCAGQEIIAGENDLLTLNPSLAKEWDYDKNDKTPSEVALNSQKLYYWKCPQGHPSYPASIANRNKGKGCPYCSGRKRLPDVNSFGAVHPELLKEIHPNQDTPFDPFNVGPMSETEVRWICKEGHDWKARVKKRSMGQGCPYCSNVRIWPGFNDLKTKFPEIAKEWHPTKNGNLTPETVGAYSNKKVWWICSKCGEPYQALIPNRTRKGTGHNKCKGKRG